MRSVGLVGVFVLSLMALLAGCSGSASQGAAATGLAGPTADAVAQDPAPKLTTEGFTLTLLPDSSGGFPDATKLELRIERQGGRTTVGLWSSAGVPELYCRLSYDPATYSSLDSGDASGVDSALTLLAHPAAGLLEYGRVEFAHSPAPINKRLLAHFSFGAGTDTPEHVTATAFPLDMPTDFRYDYKAQLFTASINIPRGDYNHDGLVSVQDIALVGQFFGTDSNSENWSKAIGADGNQDFRITAADLTSIGLFYGSHVPLAVALYSSDNPLSDYPARPMEQPKLLPLSVSKIDSSNQIRIYLEYPEYSHSYWLRGIRSNEYGPASEIFTAGSEVQGFTLDVQPETYFRSSGSPQFKLRCYDEGAEIRQVTYKSAGDCPVFYAAIKFDDQLYDPAEGFTKALPGTAFVFGIVGNESSTVSETKMRKQTQQYFTYGDGPFNFARPEDVLDPEISYEPSSHRLSWLYFARPDCNQDGLFTVDDFAYQLLYFTAEVDEATPPNSILWLVDGNVDGDITVQDLTSIGLHARQQVDGFRVYTAPSLQDYLAGTNTALYFYVPLTAGSGDRRVERLQFETPFDAPSGSVVWLSPVLGSEDGTPSVYYQIP